MRAEIVKTLITSFEEKVNRTRDGLEFWYARDLRILLGYKKWENFIKVMLKAFESCKNSGMMVSEHFPEIRKTSHMPHGAKKKIVDYMLTRYACYLIAQNGDPTKTEIAFAQTYFAIQTRKLELIEKRINDIERVRAREKLKESDKHLSGIIFERTRDEKAIGRIKNFGDVALFNKSTDNMKLKWKVPKNRPLADFAPTVVLKGKDFANELTVFNTKEKSLQNEVQITKEHVENNKSIRKAMIERGVVPENTKPELDVSTIKRKLIDPKRKTLKKI